SDTLQFETSKKDAAARLHIPRIVQKIKALVNELKGIVSVFELKKVLGPACLLIGLSFSTTTSAQVTFLAPVQNTMGLVPVSYQGAPVFVDLDNDGDKDLMVGEYYGNLQYFQNTGTVSAPAFAAPVANPFGLSATSYYALPAVADLDNDGDKDFLVGEVGGNMQYFQNTGTATAPAFAAPVANPFGMVAVASATLPCPTLSDLDNDGDYDLMIGDNGGNFQYFKNTGTATVPSFTTAAVTNPFGLTAVAAYASPTFEDVDGDGDKDLLAGEYNTGNLMYFQNTGTATVPSFTTAPVTNPFSLVAVNAEGIPAFADLDNDGDKDLMVGEAGGNFQYFERQNPITTGIKALNTSEGAFSVYPNPATDVIRISGSKLNEVTKIEVLDVAGRVCAEYQSVQAISLNGLAAGVYTLKISVQNGTNELKRFQKL
ncbi:MAG: T9SS type A sorting domain-containing protein, partial [Bacteroidia bacterium]